MPAAAALPDRLDAALTTIHLLFTTGHTAPAGPALARTDLAEHALDLARMLHRLMPDEREVRGLLALLLANHARRATRTAADGRLLLLAEQDRATWDQQAIAEAHDLVPGALRGGSPGRFALQAAIAALHATAPAYADTDWPQILQVYDELVRAWPSPVVALNRAVAVAMVSGPATALAEVEALERDERLAGYRYLPAVKADLLRRLGRPAEAALAYERALTLTGNDAERAFLTGRLAETT
jgi:RNA polymerase sigma-70 factor (ECF subfamily)